MGKIVVLTPNIDYRVGGIERFCVELAWALDMEHEVHLLEYPKTVPEIVRKSSLDSIWKSIFVRGAIKRLRPDLVVSNRDLGMLFLKVPRIHVCHGTMMSQKYADRKFQKLRDWFVRGFIIGGMLEFFSLLGATKIAVSNSAAKELRKWYSFNLVTIIPNGVQVIHLSDYTSEERHGLIFVGRPESRKGYELAVSISENLGVELKVAGSSGDSRVTSLGSLADNELQTLYRNAFGFIFPTIHEACSYAILEALANGCPVFTSRVGWVIELVEAVPEYSWLTVNPSELEKLGDVVSSAQADPARLQSTMTATLTWMSQMVSREKFKSDWLNAVKNKLDS